MSQLAQFFVVDRERVGALAEAATARRRRLVGKRAPAFSEVVHTLADEREPFDGDGTAFAALLPYLDEQGIPLMDSEFDDEALTISEGSGAGAFLMTAGTHGPLLDRAAAVMGSDEDLREYWADLYGSDDPGAPAAMRAALDALAAQVRTLDDRAVLLLLVG